MAAQPGMPMLMEPLHPRAEKLLAEAVAPGEVVLAKVHGSANFQCAVVTDQRLMIIKVGMRAGQTLGGKVASYDHRNITAVEVRASIMSGTFQVAAGGVSGVEQSAYGSGNKADSWHSPHIIPIQKRQVPKFQELAKLVRAQGQAVAIPTSPPPPPPPSPAASLADELERLASLRERGILTPEEFDAKKADLLARM